MITEQYDEIMDDLDYVAEHKTVKLGTYVKLEDVFQIIDETYDKYEKRLPIEDFGRGMDITVRIKNAISERFETLDKEDRQ